MKTGKQNKITLGIKGDRIGITCFCFFLISGTIPHCFNSVSVVHGDWRVNMTPLTCNAFILLNRYHRCSQWSNWSNFRSIQNHNEIYLSRNLQPRFPMLCALHMHPHLEPLWPWHSNQPPLSPPQFVFPDYSRITLINIHFIVFGLGF